MGKPESRRDVHNSGMVCGHEPAGLEAGTGHRETPGGPGTWEVTGCDALNREVCGCGRRTHCTVKVGGRICFLRGGSKTVAGPCGSGLLGHSPPEPPGRQALPQHLICPSQAAQLSSERPSWAGQCLGRLSRAFLF